MKLKKKIKTVVLISMLLGINAWTVSKAEYTSESRLNTNYTKQISRKGGYSQNDVRVKSGLSEVQIRELLPTNMKELSKTIYKIENSNKPINAIFLMSIIRLETGNGTSYSYNYRNNVGGVMGRRGLRSFKTKDECLYYMQDFLYRGYIHQGRISVWRIGYKYCIGGNWATKINAMAVNSMYKANRVK